MTPMATIPIPARVLAAIYTHARAAFPDECCGYLVGPRSAGVDAAVQCRNAQRDGEHPTHPDRGADTGFVIAGAELLGFARSLDSDRPARVVYHSHTNGRAYFSEVDRQVAGADVAAALGRVRRACVCIDLREHGVGDHFSIVSVIQRTAAIAPRQ